MCWACDLSRMRMKRLRIILLIWLLAPSAAQAMGISLRFVDITLEKVEPGAQFNLRVLKNLPMIVKNLDNEEGADIVIQAVLPNPTEMKDGYEPMPDPNWVRILPDHFHLGPSASASSDVVVTIPNDKSLMGRHFECIIWARTDRKNVGDTHGVVLQTGLRTRLRMSIGTMGPESLQREKALKKLAEIDTNFTISPDNLFVSEVEVGKEVDLKRDKKTSLKVINQSDNPIDLKVAPVPADPNIIPQGGYANVPDYQWLKISPAKISVNGNSIKELKMTLTVPDQPEYKNKKYMFLIKTTLTDESLPLAYYNSVYVTTKP
jgi:hypothetical protein